MSEVDLKTIKKEIKTEIEKIDNIEELELVFKKYLGKEGKITQVLRSLKELSDSKRKLVGKLANEIKLDIESKIKDKRKKIKSLKEDNLEDSFDITVPGKKLSSGHLHPLTLGRRKVKEIFEGMGFSVIEGPEMESAWYNFDSLNIPKDHPARDSWDTFWLKNGLLLRTHTSPVQVRYMEENKPPLKIIVPGNVFRHEATDASHELQFFHVEGLMVDKEISVANLKAVTGEFFSRFFDKNVKFNFKPDYFPFTEPSFQIDISCLVCDGKGCPACKRTGWLEVGGAGMVHPNVFKNSGLKAEDWQGWAFGFGLDRLIMLKHKIGNIRLFRANDIKFLKQF